MTATQIGYKTWLSGNAWISEVVGSPILAMFIGLVIVNILVVKNNIDSKTAIIINMLVAFTILSYAYTQSVVVIIGVFFAFLVYGAYSAFWK